MQKKIFRNAFLVSFVAVILTSALLLAGIYSFLEKNTLEDMRIETVAIAGGINSYGYENFLEMPYFKNSLYRMTIMNQDGDVKFDNKASNLANHKDRPEFISAIETGAGREKRYSDTLGRTTYYYAYRLEDGAVLRLAHTQKSVYAGFLQIVPMLIGVLILAGLASIVMANRTTRKIMKPIDRIMKDLDEDEDIKDFGYDEFNPFVQRINSQRARIKDQIEKLKKDKDTISTITENMREGLILLDKDENILALNQCAKEILNVKNEEFLGKNIITATRNELVNKMAKKALNGTYEEVILEQSGSIYQIHGCSVENRGETIGTVLFFVDITPEQMALKMRKEFTANVSHELKTPLTSISGFAEMLKSGLVKNEDIEKFSEKIFNECGRMITLVNDILTLSKLDERGIEIEAETVDLLDLVNNVSEGLKEEAQKEAVEISVTGESINTKISKAMVTQLLSNLIENGVKYNKQGGMVAIDVKKTGDIAKISVKDTGIGIPEEHIDRIFERFYRIEKSRAKDIGGTGLGLSIVKNIAAVLDMKVDLKSQVGKGTTVTLELKILN